MSEKRPRPRSLDYDDGVYPDENRGSGIRAGGVHYASRSDIVSSAPTLTELSEKVASSLLVQGHRTHRWCELLLIEVYCFFLVDLNAI